ncbi:MAG TPA: phage tail tape measure protein, partial [Flavobacteriaceae bacterium]|nr:phage tail tape measure protein [Flavobacteriaceae bacterium]
MAKPVSIPVTIDFTDAEKKFKRFKDRTVKIKLDPKDFNQPLGRITGQLGEFDKSLAASNARVIAFGASASAIYAIQRALSATVKSAIEVEKTLADINVILNASGTGLKKFSDELFKIAGNTGQSFGEVAKAATELARQGLSVEQTLKRTSNALILTRLSGLDAANSVESLTAAINSFNKSAINSTEIVNKLANVDAAFAVSSKDLAEAIRRVGSTASDANVSFDELVAAVTAAQQTTARGGAVIGNSFKTIFTRLQRPRVLDALKEIGIQTKAASGETRPLIAVLKDLAKVYDGLAPSVKASTSELIGGVFQINIVKAALSDLGKEFSIFDSALKTSINSTNEATKRNEALNQTMSAMLNKTFANLQKVASEAGSDMFGPMMKNLVSGMNFVLTKIGDDVEGKSVGGKIAEGVFKGIGDFLAGPGILLGALTLMKVVQRIGATATDALRSIALTTKAQDKSKEVKLATFNMLSKEPDLLNKVLNNTMSIEEAHNKILDSINDETEALRIQMQ